MFRSASGGFLLRLWVLGTGAFGLRVVCWGAGFSWSFVFRVRLALVGIVCLGGDLAARRFFLNEFVGGARSG